MAGRHPSQEQNERREGSLKGEMSGHMFFADRYFATMMPERPCRLRKLFPDGKDYPELLICPDPPPPNPPSRPMRRNFSSEKAQSLSKNIRL
jgi:hypothetical protein